MSRLTEADILFKKLDVELLENIDSQYFDEPNRFRSLIEVLGVLGEKVDQINSRGDDLLAVLKANNPAYSRLLDQRKMVEEVIEEVVTFQHGGLNNSVDTMSDVVKEYMRGRADIQGLRTSLNETQSVLTSKKSGQIPLKELWLKKVEVEESLRIVRELESLKNAPHRVQRFMQQKKYLTAVGNLNKAITSMFSEDLVAVTGLIHVREQLMDLKETLLETCVSELKEIIIGSTTEMQVKAYGNGNISDSDDGGGGASDTRSERSHFVDDTRSVRSRSLPIAGTDTDGASSSNGGVHTSAVDTQQTGDHWALDFRDLDENLETSMLDPSTSGSVFIRLLVKTVSVLNCEDDVERLLLENISKRFRLISVNKLRDFAASRLSQMLAQRRSASGGGDSDEEGENEDDDDGEEGGKDMAMHTKLFSDYVGSLLDASILALHRLLYILRLLGIIKMQRVGGYNNAHAESGQVSYAQHMQEVESGVKEQNKKLLLSLWGEIEDVIVREIKIHLIEVDVENITDHAGSGDARSKPLYNASAAARGNNNGTNENDEDDEDGEEGGSNSANYSLLFKPTARHAAPLYKRVVSYSNAINKMLRDNGLSTVEESATGGAAGSLAVERAAHQRTIAVLGAKPFNSLTIMERMSLSAAQTAIAQQDSHSVATAVKENRVLEFLQVFIEEELLPVVQGTVNRHMQEIQLHNEHFSIDLSATQNGDNVNSRRGKAAGVEVTLCYAAELCNTTSQPLFGYWLQLAQHRNMTATILDRLIRGFASAARDEFEGLTYKLLSQQQASGVPKEQTMKRGIINGTVKDPLFVSYRSKMYGGKTSLDDLLVGLIDPNNALRNSSRRGSRNVIYDSNNGIAGNSGFGGFGIDTGDGGSSQRPGLLLGLNLNALELTVWDPYWDVGNARYPITKDKIVTDFSALSTVASIAYGCDWLVKRLSSMCNATTRKVLLSANANNSNTSTNTVGGASPVINRSTAKSYTPPPIGSSTGAAANAAAASAKAAKMEIIEARNALVTSVQGGARELSNIAEECMAMLRGELEISCFYFLSSIAHIKYTKPASALPSTIAPKPSVGTKSLNPKVSGDGSFGRSRQSFIVSSGQVVHTGDEVNSEEEVVMSAFSHYLTQYVSAIANCTISSALAVVFSPLCSVIPRILMKCAMHIVIQNKLSTMEMQPASSTYMNATTTALLTASELQLKTRLLRIVVAIQQSTSVCIQSSEVEPEAKRKLQDVLTEEFERLRRYITLFDMPLGELKQYLKGGSNLEDYSKEEIKVLWFKSTNRLAESSFDEVWRDIEASANVQTKRVSATNVTFASPQQQQQQSNRR